MAFTYIGIKMNSVITLNSIDKASTDHPLRVMIVDDHELFRHGLRDLINSIEGFQVVAEASSAISLLTPQESNVFQLLRRGQSNKQIATQLSISPYTVGKHIQNILRKLGVANRTQAVAYTLFEGG